MTKPKLGRPRLKDSEKVVYQRVAIEYGVYKRFKKVVDDLKLEDPSMTNTKALEIALDALDNS